MIPQQLNDALPFNIDRVAILFRRELMKALTDYDLTPEQWQVMATLWWSSETLKQNDVCDVTLRDKPTVSRIIDRLEEKGWLERHVDEKDARATLLRLTAKGSRMKGEVPKKLVQHFSVLLKGFPAEESDGVVLALKKLRKALGE